MNLHDRLSRKLQEGGADKFLAAIKSHESRESDDGKSRLSSQLSIADNRTEGISQMTKMLLKRPNT